MSTYLLAFIITEDFKVFSNTSEQHNYTFTVFARKSAGNLLRNQKTVHFQVEISFRELR